MHFVCIELWRGRGRREEERGEIGAVVSIEGDGEKREGRGELLSKLKERGEGRGERGERG